MDSRQEVKSLHKALRALKAMNERGDATVTEIAQAIGTPRTTAYRLLTTLASVGYVEKQAHSDYYRLTSMVTQLGAGFGRESLLLEIAKPLVMALGARFGWTVVLTTPRGADIVVRITSSHKTSLAPDRREIGTALPMTQMTTGLCYLAWCPDSERDDILEIARASGNPLQALAHNRPRLDMVLERVRSRGFSCLVSPTYPDARIGVPLIVEGRPVGGVAMSYTKGAIPGETLLATFLPALHDLAREIVARYEVRAPTILSAAPADPEPATMDATPNPKQAACMPPDRPEATGMAAEPPRAAGGRGRG